MMFTTPATASDPFRALAGPRTTSIRSTASVVRPARSTAPPGWLIGTPSIITWT